MLVTVSRLFTRPHPRIFPVINRGGKSRFLISSYDFLPPGILSVRVVVCLCRFYLKTVNGNDLILFASWRDSSNSGNKILTNFCAVMLIG